VGRLIKPKFAESSSMKRPGWDNYTGGHGPLIYKIKKYLRVPISIAQWRDEATTFRSVVIELLCSSLEVIVVFDLLSRRLQLLLLASTPFWKTW
jgi:hypothetical protein